MRAELREWYPPTDSEKRALLTSGTIVLDTSSLLKLYRHSLTDRKHVLELLEAYNDRLWLPRQVAIEFQKNRLTVVYEQLDAYEEIRKEIEKFRNTFVGSLKSHPVLSQANVKREIEDRLTSLVRYVQDAKISHHPADVLDPLREDGVHDAVTRLYEGRVGPGLVEDAALEAEAKRRYDAKIPPGFEDLKTKPIPRAYGDYYWWRECLEFWGTGGSGTTAGLIVVTEEKKGDWWLKEPTRSQIVGPRPELVKEAFDAGISALWVTSLSRFFDTAANQMGWEGIRLGQASEAPGQESPRDEDSPPTAAAEPE